MDSPNEWPVTVQLLQSLLTSSSSSNGTELLIHLFKALDSDSSVQSSRPSSFFAPSPPLPTWSASLSSLYTHSNAQSTHHLRSSSHSGCSADNGLRFHRRLVGSSTDSGSFALNLAMVFVCVLCAAFASGLTQGLLSLDFTEMTIKSRSGTDNEKKYAAKVIPIISRHHLLIVTLMLWNASATEALPIFLSGLVPEYLAIVISVTLVLFVGEIIPAAILTGNQQLTSACYHLHVIC